jgi:hypothetical protein
MQLLRVSCFTTPGVSITASARVAVVQALQDSSTPERIGNEMQAGDINKIFTISGY